MDFLFLLDISFGTLVIWLIFILCLYLAIKWAKLPSEWESREKLRKAMDLEESGLQQLER